MPRFDSLAPARLALRAACCSLPRSLPTAGGVTPPADGAECGFAGQIEIAPQESRRRSRLGGATAVASLARHGICSPRLVPRTGRHMPRRSSRSLGCAVAARRLLPLPLRVSRSRRPFQSLEAPCRAGLAARLRWGGGAVSAANAGNKGAPSSPRSSSVRRVGFKVVPTSTLLATRHLQPCPCIVAFRSPLVPRCARPAIMPRPPKVSRSMFRPGKPGLTSSGKLSLPPAGTLHARQSLRFCACHGSCSPTPCAACAPSSLRPRRKKCSAAHEAR